MPAFQGSEPDPVFGVFAGVLRHPLTSGNEEGATCAPFKEVNLTTFYA
jgi:hypothetical protein